MGLCLRLGRVWVVWRLRAQGVWRPMGQMVRQKLLSLPLTKVPERGQLLRVSITGRAQCMETVFSTFLIMPYRIRTKQLTVFLMLKEKKFWG
ncbi:hypothetical protein D3C87_1916120 [compost metagenome]